MKIILEKCQLDNLKSQKTITFIGNTELLIRLMKAKSPWSTLDNFPSFLWKVMNWKDLTKFYWLFNQVWLKYFSTVWNFLFWADVGRGLGSFFVFFLDGGMSPCSFLLLLVHLFSFCIHFLFLVTFYLCCKICTCYH